MRILHALLAAFALPLLPALRGETAKAPETNIVDPGAWVPLPADPLVQLDTGQRAQGHGDARFLFVTHQQLEVLKRNYDSNAFDKWVEKLKTVRLGMTVDQIQTALSSKTGNAMGSHGSGVTVCFGLDDVYFVHGLFDETGRLKIPLTNPIAITYTTSLRVKSLPKQRGIIEHLGLPE